MEEEYGLRVGDIYHTLGGSTQPLISVELPQKILLLVQSTYINSTSKKSDTAIWKPNSKGILTTSSAYRFLQENKPEYQQNISNPSWIWSLNCPNKIKFFLWLCHHNRLPTKSYLKSIGIDISDLCNLCKKNK
ncbi:hypothetical protein R3W88_004953 [Solanum pinnatisectum]|uniref:Reverse transcriptase zinc-binding domain-containing protein n=1 Tax=Solanum pinnatisectum TaxID=50273 RepID=A0AAV9KAQ3_9SOLN|nr:hypothetical protein R3W88_004953 [Solanum pinnatisectum]